MGDSDRAGEPRPYSERKLRERHKKNYPILWDGHLVPPYIISRQDACTTREFGIFFYLEVSNRNVG